ncbi:hypothetical protein K3495_g3426 [Podosphaera aphanis]|nr:hypothetical protein K3495_g3426 [Podosphaera aphanis]
MESEIKEQKRPNDEVSTRRPACTSAMEPDAEGNLEDGEQLRLSTAAQAALAEFYAERAAHEERFRALPADPEILSMDAFVESWQDSQFWYEDATARTLATALLGDAAAHETLAIVSAPSVFVMARNLLIWSGRPKQTWPKLLLLEFDRRFEVFGDAFVFYDFRNPLKLPEGLKAAVDHIICDPPFLSDECQTRTAMTVRWLSKSWGIPPDSRAEQSRLIICTGERMEDTITKLYKQQGIATTNFEPVHSKSQLSNEFYCYANFECGQWKNKAKT